MNSHDVTAAPVLLSTASQVPVIGIGSAVCAGFPSPAEDLGAKRIDLNDVLIKHPLATYLMRVSGPSMREAGIDDGDFVVVDKSIKACHGHIVVAVVDGEFTIKRLYKRGGRIKLQAANPTYPDIVPHEELVIWGVARHCIKALPV